MAPLVLLAAALANNAAYAQAVEERRTDGRPAPAAPSTGDAPVEPSAVVEQVAQRTNAFRKQEGRAALAWNAELAATARDFAQFMARTDRYGHEVDGNRPSERAQQHGYDYCLVAENIAYQYRSSGFADGPLAHSFVEGWRNSPPHRRNMLDRDVIETGVAVAQSPQTGRWYGVQMFGLPKSVQRTFSVTNSTGTPVTYRVADERFDLPPRLTRTHERCRPVRVHFAWPGGQPTTSIEPKPGQHYRVARSSTGHWQLQRQ